MKKFENLRLLGIILTLMVIWPISARVEECGAMLQGDGVLQSRNFPSNYPNDYNCDWTFDGGAEDTVTLTFTHFDIEDSTGCRYDYLQVFAMGQAPKYCGTGVQKVAPGGILTAKGPVKLVFKSDDSETKKGFRLEYSITEPEPEKEESILSCKTEPCKNGADCVDIDVGEVACFCLDGFEGEFCEINIDECASNPCQNGGTCTDEVEGFSCDCPEGFLGVTCGVDVDDCIADPCRNGGTCIDGANSFECQCVTGYTGWNCGQDIDECVSGPCLNMGVCEDRIGFYECVCFPGYTGVNCEIPPPTTAAAPEPQTTPAVHPTEPSPRHRQPDNPPEQLGDPTARNAEPSQPPVEPSQPAEAASAPDIPQDPSPSRGMLDGPSSLPTNSPVEPENEDVDDSVNDFPILSRQTTPAPDVADGNYLNTTVGKVAETTTQNNISPDSDSQDGGNEESNDSSTGMVIGIIAGSLGIVALASIATRYWITNNNTKVQPITDESSRPSEVRDEKVDSTEPSDKEEGNKLDLVEEDFTGRMKFKIGGPNHHIHKATDEYREFTTKSTNEIAEARKHSPTIKAPKKKLTFGKRIKSTFARSKTKLPTAVETTKDKAIAQTTENISKTSIVTTVPGYIPILNQFNANLDKLLETSYTPYGRSMRNRKTAATRRLMSAMAKEHFNRSTSQSSHSPPLSPTNPFLGQGNMFTFQQNQYPINTSNNYGPLGYSPFFASNPFIQTPSKPNPAVGMMHLSPDFCSLQDPISTALSGPTNPNPSDSMMHCQAPAYGTLQDPISMTLSSALNSNSAVGMMHCPAPAITALREPSGTTLSPASHNSAVGMMEFPELHCSTLQIPISTTVSSPSAVPLATNQIIPPANEQGDVAVNQELSPSPRKSKKKSKKHKRSKKKALMLDASDNVAGSESPFVLQDAADPLGTYRPNIEALGGHLTQRSHLRRSSIANPTNGINAPYTQTPLAREESMGNFENLPVIRNGPRIGNIANSSAFNLSNDLTFLARRDSSLAHQAQLDVVSEMDNRPRMEEPFATTNNVPYAGSAAFCGTVNVAENVFFPHVSTATSALSASNSPSYRLGNLASCSRFPSVSAGSVVPNNNRGGPQNIDNRNINFSNQSSDSNLITQNHTILSAQNSNTTNQGLSPHLSPAMTLETQNADNNVPGFSFWR